MCRSWIRESGRDIYSITRFVQVYKNKTKLISYLFFENKLFLFYLSRIWLLFQDRKYKNNRDKLNMFHYISCFEIIKII